MRKSIAVIAVALTLGVAACSSNASGSHPASDTGANASHSGSLDVVRAGLLPNAETAAIRLGKNQGFFANHGIDLQITNTTSGAASVTALIAGQFDLVFANTVSDMQGRDKGLPLVMLAAASTSTGVNGKDFSALVVASDSKFKTAADLAGKTVASNTVKNIGEVTARLSILKAGGSDANTKFVEMPFANMEQALENHQIDAAWMVEPFHTKAISDGLRDLASNYVDTAPNLTAAAFVTTKGFIKDHSDLAKRLKEAITESGNYGNSHPNEIRALIPKFTSVSAQIANEFVIPLYNPEVNQKSLEAMLPEMVKLGMISKGFDVSSMIYQ